MKITHVTRNATAILIATALGACSHGGSSVAPTPIVPSAPVVGSGSVGTLAFGQTTLTGAAAGAAAQLGAMRINVGVKLRNASGLATFAAAASDPSSGAYRHFLTPQQIADQFGATTSDYTATATYFRSMGLKVGTWPQRLSLTVAGPQAAMEAAFHTHFVTYATAQGSLYGPKEPPTLPAGLPVTSVAHLIDGTGRTFRQSVRASSVGSGQNTQLGYTPQQVSAAFDYNGAKSGGFTGTGINVGIVATGPIDLNDFSFYRSYFGISGAGSVSQVNVSTPAAEAAGSSPAATPPPVTGPCTGALPTCNPEDGEAQIDVEQVNGLVPNANVLFYLAYIPAECGAPTCPPGTRGFLGIAESDDEIQQAIADNTADILSLSFGGGEPGNTFYFLDGNGAYTSAGFGPTEFAALAAEGIAVFVSSGDSGAQGCSRPAITGFVDSQCVSYPASDVSVTSVGGVTTPLSNGGQFVGPVTGWGLQTNGGQGGSGGGVSRFIPQPTWQTGTGITAGKRNQPDISLEGDDATGVAVISNTSFDFSVSGAFGGTSVAAPEMASMWALVLDACKQTASCAAQGTGAHPYRMGNAGPVLYKIYNTPASYAASMLDVTFGNNSVIGCTQGGPACPSPVPAPDPGFTAGIGYDMVTGIGVPFARHLIKAVVGV
jgi:subtilase family serine protease